MRRVFIDTSYLIAIINPRDDHHQRAEAVSKRIGTYSAVTSEMVLTEFLNYFSAKGPQLRQMSLKSIESLCSDPNIEVVPQTSQQFDDALRYYRNRPDKGYSLTDCASMLIMKEKNLQDVLTHDQHFQQEGFCALLRNI